MKASDLMTPTVITAHPSDTIESAVEKMLEHHISALPVVDAAGAVVGIVSEGDLMDRPETQTARKRSWWLELFRGPETSARDFLKSHGTRVADVMTNKVVSVTEDETAAEIARKLEKHRIKRVPVVRDGTLVGIVSRANLLRTFASGLDEAPADAQATRDAILAYLEEAGLMTHLITVTVTDDAVEMWGMVSMPEQIDAARAAAERAAPGKKIENHLSLGPGYVSYL